MKVGNHAVGNREVVGWKNKLMGPALIGVEGANRRHRRLQTPHDRGAHGTDFTVGTQRIVNNIRSILRDDQLLRVHFVFGEIFHLNGTKSSQSNV